MGAKKFALEPPQNLKSVWIELEPKQPPSPENGKKLLLSHSPTQKTEVSPANAKYFSDRNQYVKQETRARAFLTNPVAPSIEKKEHPDFSQFGPRSHDLPQPSAQPLEDELTWGAENLLNTAENTYYSFYARIYESLAPVWQSQIRSSNPGHALSPGDYRVVANLVLDSKGVLIGVEFEERSSVTEFNEAVIRSVKKVNRFPNPPKSLMNAQEQVRTLWSFTVNVGNDSLLQFQAPTRLN